MMLMNPDPVCYMRLYANWIDDDEKESRVGRAVWNAKQAVEAGSKEETKQQIEAEAEHNGESVNIKLNGEGVGDHTSGEEEGKDNEDDNADSDDDDAFTAQEYSVDLNALARGGGKHNIIFMGNQMQQPILLSREQISQLRTAPNGDFMMPGRTPRGASRMKMLPPRAKKGVRAIVTTDDVPEPNCACGLSRYRVSAKAILTMTTKTAEVEHRCMGSLFERVDAPHDVTDAIKVRRFNVKAGGKSATKEEMEHSNS